MLKLPKKEANILTKSINHLSENGDISKEEHKKLLNSFEVISFDFNKLAKYSFWIALICIFIALISVVADKALLALIEKLFSASITIKFVSFTFFTSLVYCYGIKRQKSLPSSTYKNHAILFIGNFLAVGSFYYLYKLMNVDKQYISDFLLLCGCIYGILAYISQSKLTWVLSIFILAGFYGLQFSYGWGGYSLGIGYPLKFLLFSLFLIAISFVMHKSNLIIEFQRTTYIMGLLFAFIALWMLSIFGNYTEMKVWSEVAQLSLLHWSLLFAFAAICAIYYGLKNDDYASRSFGITFLFINLYTRFFEFFWNSTHKVIFFSILAISFWLIGSKAEKIWNYTKEITK